METSKIRNQVFAWLQQCQREQPLGLSYAFSAEARDPTLISLCLAILIAELYDKLPGVLSQDSQRVLLSAQDPLTGLFVDPLFTPDDLETGHYGEDYIRYQTTYFALNALDALGCTPCYPLSYLDPFLDTVYLDLWLEKLDWSRPWRESNRIMFIATPLYLAWQWKKDRSAFLALNHLLDWLDAHQDAETGFWGVHTGAPLLHAMAATYHFLPFYFCLGRSFHFPEQMIQSTLALQQTDGLFHPQGGGDACLDVDAIDILVKCSLVTSHRANEVQTALEQAYLGLLENQEAQGGFCRARRRPFPSKSWKRRLAEAFGVDRLLGKPYLPPREIWHYSSWEKMPFDIRLSDLWSTWFRSFGLAVISARYPERFPTDINWVFRETPALGWHDPVAIVASQNYHWNTAVVAPVSNP